MELNESHIYIISNDTLIWRRWDFLVLHHFQYINLKTSREQDTIEFTLVSTCPSTVTMNALITKPVSFLCPENITSNLSIFTVKMTPKQCRTPKKFFKTLVIIISGASNIDDMSAQIVIFQLVVNHKSWIGHQIQKGHLTIGGCILDDDSVTCTLNAAKHDLILLFGFKAINMIKDNILRDFIFFFLWNCSLFFYTTCFDFASCVYIYSQIEYLYRYLYVPIEKVVKFYFI